MIRLSKEMYTGTIKYNGDHYFAGDQAKGYLILGDRTGRVLINHQWTDMFGNVWGDTLEVEPNSLKKVEE